VLSWITYARRALTTEELSHALAVEAGESELDEDNIPDIEDMVSVCAGLVTVDEESNIIRLVHYTTQEYFERIREDWNPYAQQEIALACLTYLSFETFRAGGCPSNEDFEHRLTRSPFLDYAARHWGQHALTVQRAIKTVALPFLCDKALVSCSTQVTSIPQNKYGHYGSYSQKFPRHVTGMHLAASFGLTCLLQDLIDGDGNGHRLHIDVQDSPYGQTPLLRAAENGHELAVELLLNKGADVNAQGEKEYGSALQAASFEGHDKIVELLLSKGADVNAQGGYYGCALHAASLEGHDKTIELLLSKGTDVNAQGRGYDEALQVASLKGHDKTVELLLSKGADVNAQVGHYGSALQAASFEGHDKTVELLLSKGADVSAQGGYYGSALQAASLEGHDKTVELLLSKGADVNTQGGCYGSALQAASLEGHQAVSLEGHDKIVELLLSKGADVNAQGGHYGSALQAASFEGYDNIVELLLSKGADVNTQGGHYGSALQAALYGGHNKTVELLSKDADVNAHYGSALWRYRGHDKVIKLLLSKGAV
jgi:ankyrin repeat protein